MKGVLMKRKKIVILGTGGTIAAVGEDGSVNNYTAGEVAIEELLHEIPGIHVLAELQTIQICNMSSTDISSKEWYRLLQTIQELEADDSIYGYVVTHGTDTMEETAYFLHLTAHTKRPIVFTGSMRPTTAISADGAMNMYQAVAVAAQEESIGKGVLVVFADCIYSARDVQKINGFRLDAFGAKDMGIVGYIMHDIVQYYYQTTRKHTYNSVLTCDLMQPLPRVNILYYNVDANVDILLEVAKQSDGLVIAGTGAGGVSELWIQAIQEIEQMQIPVIRSSRIGNGCIPDVELQNCGENVITGDTLNPSKAKILLQLTLMNRMNYTEIKECFLQY